MRRERFRAGRPAAPACPRLRRRSCDSQGQPAGPGASVQVKLCWFITVAEGPSPCPSIIQAAASVALCCLSVETNTTVKTVAMLSRGLTVHVGRLHVWSQQQTLAHTALTVHQAPFSELLKRSLCVCQSAANPFTEEEPKRRLRTLTKIVKRVRAENRIGMEATWLPSPPLFPASQILVKCTDDSRCYQCDLVES